ncbi:hypothetical protein OS493_012080 [Desmophyllum pertusum]|uniref:Uncharacterized protein n=1 Tax=Desmophyllum pertusum TaxID=174260 RepID=A0A9X0A2T6_9CNID|nr:hypothetical protein OS493_012080 [Desmophyllum pertusum]
MRSSLVQFTQKTQDWDRDDLAELRIYHKHKWKVPSVLSAALQSAQVKDKQAKQAYVDKRNRASPSDIKSGDKVLLYNRRGRTSYRRGAVSCQLWDQLCSWFTLCLLFEGTICARFMKGLSVPVI